MKRKFNEYLTILRKRNGYTQAQMADYLGIPRSTYANYESGNRSPDLDTLVDISDILDCSLDELFGRTHIQSGNTLDIVREEGAPYGVRLEKSKKTKKKLVLGVQDFRTLREKNGYYVDKTLMIEEFLETGYQMTLITRPRRFGKTLNMSMIAEFLDGTKNSEDIFKGTKISERAVYEELNQHPVIFLSFLNVKGDTVSMMLDWLALTISREYERYMGIFQEGILTDTQKEEFYHVYQGLKEESTEGMRESCISRAILVLCQTLEAYYKKKVYLFLDEYDTPFISANVNGIYDEIKGMLSGMLVSALKGNDSLEKALITGIQHVAKENIFSGLNNLIVCTVRDYEYSDYFGFTEGEVRALLSHYGILFTDEVQEMYDGYLFGTAEVYNPWSVTNYAARKRLEPYWMNISENSIITNALEKQGSPFESNYNELMEKGQVVIQAELVVSYFEQPDDASLWGMLINTGMITVQEDLGDDYYTVRIPNHEVRKAFQQLTAFYLQIQTSHISHMLRSLRMNSMKEFAEEYQRILMTLPSYHDLKSENSYHMMMLGMCSFLYQYYEVKSNRESGTGRSDITLLAKKPDLPHMILEFKYTKEKSQNLQELAHQAMEQIKEEKYDIPMDGQVIYIGLAHYGKRAEVVWEYKEE